MRHWVPHTPHWNSGNRGKVSLWSSQDDTQARPMLTWAWHWKGDKCWDHLVKGLFHLHWIRPLVIETSDDGTDYPGVHFSPGLLLTAHQRTSHPAEPKSKLLCPLPTMQSSSAIRVLTFFKTKRDRVGSRKPKHALNELMTKDIRATLGKLMSFQNECSLGSDSSG